MILIFILTIASLSTVLAGTYLFPAPLMRGRLVNDHDNRVSPSLGGFSRNKRLVEYYNIREVTRVYGQDFAENLREISINDIREDAFTPRSNDHISERTSRFGMVTLGHKIASSRESVIYTIQDRPYLLIKYQANCVDWSEHDIHPLLVDYILGKRAESLDVGPRLHYLSPPGQVCDNLVGKCDFSMDQEIFQSCLQNPGSSLRYMIMDRVIGESLWEMKSRFVHGIIPVSTSLAVGIGIVELLERLHESGRMIHGDIHLNNIMIERSYDVVDTGEKMKVKLIDYGRSCTIIPKPNIALENFGWAVDSQFSSWELEGFEPAARDDVERAIHVVARLMMPWNYIEEERSISENGGSFKIWKWKHEGNWFLQPPSIRQGLVDFDPIEAQNVPNTIKQSMREHFRRLLDIIRQMIDVNSVPWYSELIRLMETARH